MNSIKAKLNKNPSLNLPRFRGVLGLKVFPVMADSELEKVEAIWVNMSEAAEISGYNYHSIRKLAWKLGQEPEEQREIKVRKRSNGWEMWLPDLVNYMRRSRTGPPIKSKSQHD